MNIYISVISKILIYVSVEQSLKETVSHYLLECNEFDTARELMRKKLFETCGIIHLDMNILVDAKPDDIYKDWRSVILSELENFVAETRHFAS